MSTNERVRSILLHMREDCEDAIAFAGKACSYDAFHNDKLLRKAIIMSIINIGELAKRLPDDFKAEYPSIPWRKIAGMRDLSAHGYHTLDYSIIWNVAQESIPELLSFINTYFESETQ